MKPIGTFVALGLLALAATLSAPDRSMGVNFGEPSLDNRAPPVVRREAVILQVLPETGACFVHLSIPSVPCPRVQLPDGSVVDTQIGGFDRGGPLTIHVDRLTYDWAQATSAHNYAPVFEYTGAVDYGIWTADQWGPCENDACAGPDPTSVHLAYAVPVHISGHARASVFRLPRGAPAVERRNVLRYRTAPAVSGTLEPLIRACGPSSVVPVFGL